MGRSISGSKLTLKMVGTLRNTLTDASMPSVASPDLSYAKTLASGIGVDQANRSWMSENRTLENTHQDTFDLYDMSGVDIGAGAGLDALGQDIVFQEIVAIAIVNENAVTAAGQLEVFPSSSEGWDPIGSHTVANGGALRGGGVLFMAQPATDGFDVDPDSSHRITCRASGGSVTYSIYIFARDDDAESTSSSSSSVSSSSVSSSSTSSSSSSQSTSSISTSSSSVSTSSQSSFSSSSQSSSSQSTSSSSQSTSSSESSSSLSSQS